MKNYFLLCLVTALSKLAFAGNPIKVPVAFVEALAPRDTTSSERFTKEYESAIQIGKELTKKRLSGCGYELATTSHFYDANDPIQAKEQAEKAVMANSWLIVGPRRSNHYLLLVKGSGQTPTVSIMASATEIKELGPTHFTLSPLNSDMAKSAAKIAAKRGKGASFLSVVSDDCISCKDFADHFELQAKKQGLKLVERIPITGELPNTESLTATVLAKKPKFILIPNYSKTASHLIAAIHRVDKSVFFVGGDGWGDSKFGFVQNGQDIGQAEGFTVRGFPEVETGLGKFPLGRQALKSGNRPTSGPSMAILKAIEATGEILCSEKPKTAKEFAKHFAATSARRFGSPWGISVYSLSNGEINFKESVKP